MVDLQTAIDEINTGKIEFDYKDDDCCTTEGEVVILLKRLAELEKADVVEVKHGEWVHSSRGFDVDGDYECSMCHSPDGIKHFFGLKKYSFCPHCGAKMDGGKAE